MGYIYSSILYFQWRFGSETGVEARTRLADYVPHKNMPRNWLSILYSQIISWKKIPRYCLSHNEEVTRAPFPHHWPLMRRSPPKFTLYFKKFARLAVCATNAFWDHFNIETAFQDIEISIMKMRRPCFARVKQMMKPEFMQTWDGRCNCILIWHLKHCEILRDFAGNIANHLPEPMVTCCQSEPLQWSLYQISSVSFNKKSFQIIVSEMTATPFGP